MSPTDINETTMYQYSSYLRVGRIEKSGGRTRVYIGAYSILKVGRPCRGATGAKSKHGARDAKQVSVHLMIVLCTASS